MVFETADATEAFAAHDGPAALKLFALRRFFFPENLHVVSFRSLAFDIVIHWLIRVLGPSSRTTDLHFGHEAGRLAMNFFVQVDTCCDDSSSANYTDH